MIKKGKKKPSKTPAAFEHPLWEDFIRYVMNGIHFNVLPFDQMFNMTRDNQDEWMPYWNTFLHGVLMGRDQVIDRIPYLIRKEIEKHYGN